MYGVKAYLLSVCGAALVCAIANRFVENRGSAAGIGKLLIGSFLVLTVLGPIPTLKLDFLDRLTLNIQEDATHAVRQGEENTYHALSEIIKQRTAAYILQKAQKLNISLDIEVVVSDDDIPAPEKIFLSGTVAPFAKRQLQQMIEQDLGIAKECQIWT